MYHEKNISAQSYQTCQNPRVSETDVNKSRSQYHQTAQSKRKKTSDSLIPAIRDHSSDGVRSCHLPKYSFRKTDRILKRADFIRLSKSGQKIRNRFFIANCSSSDTEYTRLGLTVSKRVGNAVTRNRMKRLCRECFRLYRHNITVKRDINIVVTKEAANLSAERFFSSLQKLFDRVDGAHR